MYIVLCKKLEFQNFKFQSGTNFYGETGKTVDELGIDVIAPLPPHALIELLHNIKYRRGNVSQK